MHFPGHGSPWAALEGTGCSVPIGSVIVMAQSHPAAFSLPQSCYSTLSISRAVEATPSLAYSGCDIVKNINNSVLPTDVCAPPSDGNRE